MKKSTQTRILAVVLFIALIAASAMFSSCKEKDKNVLGSGEMSFTLKITDGSGETKTYTIKTDAKTLGAALVDVKLTTDTGYITTLDGISAIWDDETQDWWQISVNGVVAEIGAFDIELEKNATYLFKIESGMGDWDE